MLVLTAFQLTRAMGLPGDIVWVADDSDDGLATLQAKAFAPWGESGRTPAEAEVCEMWRIRPAPSWSRQMVRVCRLEGGRWVGQDQQPV